MRPTGSTLALLVARVGLADDHDVAVATDHLAVVADRLDAGVDLHCVSLGSLSSYLSHAGARGLAVTFQQGLLVAVHDPTTGQIVRAQFDDHTVFGEDADVVLPHLSRNVCKNFMAVRQLNAEHRVGKSFNYCALDLDDTVFFGHNLFIAKSIVLVVRWIVASHPVSRR